MTEKIRQVVEEVAVQLYKHLPHFENLAAAEEMAKYVARPLLDAVIEWKKEQRGKLIKKSGEKLSREQSRDNTLLYHVVQLDLMLLEEARTSITNSTHE